MPDQILIISVIAVLAVIAIVIGARLLRRHKRKARQAYWHRLKRDWRRTIESTSNRNA